MKTIQNRFWAAALIILATLQPSLSKAQSCISECSYGDLNACTQCQQADQHNSYQKIQQQNDLRQMQVQQELDQLQHSQYQQQMNQPRQVTCQTSGGMTNCTRW